jgi:hypothetical protein
MLWSVECYRVVEAETSEEAQTKVLEEADTVGQSDLTVKSAEYYGG